MNQNLVEELGRRVQELEVKIHALVVEKNTLRFVLSGMLTALRAGRAVPCDPLNPMQDPLWAQAVAAMDLGRAIPIQ